MSTYKVCLPEMMRVWAQWLGLGLAAIPSGAFLGILLKSGVNEAAALAFALPVGFVLGIVAWIVVGRWIVVKPIEYTTGLSFETISLDRAGAFAVAMLCITLHSTQPQMTNQMGNTVSALHHAIPQR
jgi:hypothetical protein